MVMILNRAELYLTPGTNVQQYQYSIVNLILFKMVWMETPTNPTLKLIDIQAVCDVAHQTKVSV